MRIGIRGRSGSEFDYVQICRLTGRKIVEGAVLIFGVGSVAPGSPRRGRSPTAYLVGVSAVSGASFRACGFAVLSFNYRLQDDTGDWEVPRTGRQGCLPYGANQVRRAWRRRAASWSLGPRGDLLARTEREGGTLRAGQIVRRRLSH